MSKRMLISLAAVVLLLGGAAVIANARSSSMQATCTANPGVTDDGDSQQISVVCSVPKPPAATVTTTVTAAPTAPGDTASSGENLPSPADQAAPSASASSPASTPASTPADSAASSPPSSPASSPPSPPPSRPSGDFPNASDTGVPAGTALTPYGGSCLISSPVVIDAKTITCPNGLEIQAAGVVIRNSLVNGRILVDTDTDHTWSLELTDSEVDAGSADLSAISSGNVAILRADIHGGHNGLECQEHSSFCSMRDSWIHDQWQAPSGDTHLGGVLGLGTVVPCTGTDGLCMELVHNRITCDAPVNSSGGGCTGDINLINHFGPLHGALVQDNLLGANAGSAYCTYGGAGFEYPSDHIEYTGNVFERGANGKCAAYGPVTSFDVSEPTNVWSDNVWDDGTPVKPAR